MWLTHPSKLIFSVGINPNRDCVPSESFIFHLLKKCLGWPDMHSWSFTYSVLCFLKVQGFNKRWCYVLYYYHKRDNASFVKGYLEMCQPNFTTSIKCVRNFSVMFLAPHPLCHIVLLFQRQTLIRPFQRQTLLTPFQLQTLISPLCTRTD